MHPDFVTIEINSHGKLLREGHLIIRMMAKAWGFIPGWGLYRGGAFVTGNTVNYCEHDVGDAENCFR